MPSTRPGRTSRSTRMDVPILWGTVGAIALAAVGAFVGFDVIGSIGPVPVLLVVIVAVFLVGAALTVRRIAALRTTDDAGRRRP